METFNDIYEKEILSKYNALRNPYADQRMINEMRIDNPYNIRSRTSFADFPCYTIDPAGCQDADDGWGIVNTGSSIHLAIHIADPTSYIDSSSELFADMLKRATTHYPSNKNPIHMMPKEIMERSSLTENYYGSEKKAVTLLIDLDEQLRPTGIVKLMCSIVVVSKHNQYTYESAAEEIGKMTEFDNSLNIALIVSKQMREVRKTVGKKLAYLNSSTIHYERDTPILKKTTPQVQAIKEMIAEFAIYYNTYIGHLLKNSLWWRSHFSFRQYNNNII